MNMVHMKPRLLGEPMVEFAQALGLPIDISAHGYRIDAIIGWVHVMMFVLFVGWGAFFIYTMIRFRRRKNPIADPQGVRSHATSYLEAAIVVIELVLLFALSIPFWASTVAKVPEPSEAMRVRVVAQQFQWNIHYAGPDGVFGRTDPSLVRPQENNHIGLDRDDLFGKDDVTTNNQLNVPIDQPVVIELSSLDVVHSFFVPVLRVKQDAVPGLVIPLTFTATSTGKYEIACAQLCGIGHAQMRGFITLMEPTEFDQWLTDRSKEAQETGPSSFF